MIDIARVPTLEQYRAAYCSRRFLATPLSGLICWSCVGIGSLFLSPIHSFLLLYIATGSIVYLAIFISKLTGETFFQKDKNPFDRLFIAGLFMSLLVYAIAIPFAVADHRSSTLSVGILTGLMWMPFSWMLQHWVGYFHAVCRTVLVLAAWYAFPARSFQVIPAIIVALYTVTILVLERRWRREQVKSVA